VGRALSTNVKERDACKLLAGNYKQRYHYKDQDEVGCMILK
jgi:hypothetical protein